MFIRKDSFLISFGWFKLVDKSFFSLSLSLYIGMCVFLLYLIFFYILTWLILPKHYCLMNVWYFTNIFQILIKFFFRVRWSLKFASKNLSWVMGENPKRVGPPNVFRVRCKTEFSDLWKNFFTITASGLFKIK